MKSINSKSQSFVSASGKVVRNVVMFPYGNGWRVKYTAVLNDANDSRLIACNDLSFLSEEDAEREFKFKCSVCASSDNNDRGDQPSLAEQDKQNFYADGSDHGCYNFFDWFCSDKSLKGRNARLARRVRQVMKANAQNPNPRFDPSHVYVFFKNNYPMSGKMYDDFRICDLRTGDVLFTVTPASGRDIDAGKPSSVWVRHGIGMGEEVRGQWEDVIAFFKS